MKTVHPRTCGEHSRRSCGREGNSFMCQTSFDAGARRGEYVAHKEIERLRSALKVIYTWAAYDREQGLLTEDRALHNKHVIELCEKALNG